jgi:hypothetical protein
VPAPTHPPATQPPHRASPKNSQTKHPTFFNQHPALKAKNATIDALLMAEMARLGYDLSAPIGSAGWLKRPAFIQSFEQARAAARRLRPRASSRMRLHPAARGLS